MTVQVGKVLEFMEPDHRKILEGMLPRVGATIETTVDEVLRLFPSTGIAEMRHDEGIALLALVGANVHRGKFAAKLTFEQRCQVLGLHRLGYSRDVLAKLYNVDRRTITHIHNPQSPHYKNVREEERRMGTPNFMQKYVTAEVTRAALAYVEGNKQPEGNNKYANRRAGVHTVKGTYCKHDHRVIIAWKEVIEGVLVPGWYYQDLDSDFPDGWFSPSEDSLKSSQTCYAAMLEDIADKLEA